MQVETSIEVLEAIQEFGRRNNSQKQLKLPMISISEVASILEPLGFEQKEITGEELNGWEVDFWYDFERGDEVLCLSGSLNSGNFKLTRE